MNKIQETIKNVVLTILAIGFFLIVAKYEISKFLFFFNQ